MYLGLACIFGTATAVLAADPGSEDPNNWPQYNRTANAWRYSPLDQINKGNVDKLSVAWIAHGGDITMGIQETPLAIDGVIYSITSGDRVAALDGKTGQPIWTYEPRLDPLTKKILFAPYSLLAGGGFHTEDLSLCCQLPSGRTEGQHVTSDHRWRGEVAAVA